MDSANATATSLIAGSVDAAISGPGELIAAQARGVDMVVVANIYNGLNGTLVMSKAVADQLGVAPDAPVEERLKALDGRVVATTSSTSAFTVSSRAAIEATGAKPSFVFMGQPAMQAAMESGSIHAYMASAPFWTIPVLNDTGYVWVSGPKGEFPRDLTPASAVGVYAMRDHAEERSEVMGQIAAVFAELAQAFEERPDEVKAAIGRAYPNIGPETIETFYDIEQGGFMARTLTVEDMAHEIGYVKLGGANLPGIDSHRSRSTALPLVFCL